MPEYPILRDAEFDPKVRTYWLLSPLIPLTVMIVTIPIVPIVWLIGRLMVDRYIAGLGCTLTTRTLEVRKGIFNRTESTIPLEKITDLQMFQGPIMRHFGLHGFKVETAGQTNVAGALLSMVGIVGAPDFRRAVLDQRDALSDRTEGATGGDAGRAAPSAASEELLREIRDAVLRMERSLAERDG
jgi:putative membrane protein